MNDREDGIAALHEGLDKGEIDGAVIGHPAAADGEDDAGAVGIFLGCEDVHGERGAELAPVNHVLLTSWQVVRAGLRQDGRRESSTRARWSKHHHERQRDAQIPTAHLT